MDVYESSPGEECAFEDPSSAIDSKNNIAKKVCEPTSTADGTPWVFVTFHQAKELCAKRGMRLPSSDEWYEASLGTPIDAACNIKGSRASGEKYAECISSRGVVNMIGCGYAWWFMAKKSRRFSSGLIEAEKKQWQMDIR